MEEELSKHDFDAVGYLNEQLGYAEGGESSPQEYLSRIISGLKNSEKTFEIDAEKSMEYVNGKIERIWGLFEKCNFELISLRKEFGADSGVIEGVSEGDEVDRAALDSSVDQKLMEDMIGLNLIKSRSEGVLEALKSKKLVILTQLHPLRPKNALDCSESP